MPIFKKSETTPPENYRAKSLLCSISKTIEKLLCNPIVHFFVKNNLFASQQFEFRKKVPALTQLVLWLTTEKKKLKNNGGKRVSLIPGKGSTPLIIQYCWKIYMFTVTKDQSSNIWANSSEIGSIIERLITIRLESYNNTGVPQESFWGTMLFLVYTNDLPRHI